MRSPLGFRLLAAVLVLSSGSGAPCAQTTWFVDVHAAAPGLGTPGAPYASLQYAIDRPTTVAGDTLLVAAGTYVELITLTKPIQVRATSGPRATVLLKPAGAPGTHVFLGPLDPDLESSTRLEGFTITGTTSVGPAVNLHGGTLERCLVAGNLGLGVSSIFGKLKRCTIADNAQGVFFATFGETTLADSVVWGNATDVVGIGGFGSARYTTFGTNPSAFLLGAGPGNESADPLFADAAAADYRLRLASPCVDSADPSLPRDPDGTRADRGAFPPRHLFQQLGR